MEYYFHNDFPLIEFAKIISLVEYCNISTFELCLCAIHSQGIHFSLSGG